MIDNNIKPSETYTKLVDESKTHKQLKILIQVYPSPVIQTGTTMVHTIISIHEEEREGEYTKPFGKFLYQAQLTEKEAKEAFQKIKKDPEKFKNS